MKILLINNCHQFRGGADTVYLNTAQLLQSCGHEVVFLSFEDEKNIHTDCKEYFVKRDNKIKTIRDYFFNPNAANKLDEVLRLEHPDIAHAHLLWGGMSPSIFEVLQKYNIPLVHTAHDYRMVCPAYLLKDGRSRFCERCKGGKFYNCSLHRCSKGSIVESFLMALEMYHRTKYYQVKDNIDGLVFVSNFSKNKHYSFDQSLTSVPCEVIYNCPGKMVEKSYDASINGYDSYFLYYGRLSDEKGIRTLIRAFEGQPKQQLMIVGTGPIEKELVTYCKEKSLGNISFMSYKSGKELYDIVAHAKYVCVPSECYENNPMTIVEAYSLRVPVIGAAIGGISEVVKDKETGFLFESGSLDSLKGALNRALSIDESEYAILKNNALVFANNNFSRDVYLNHLIGFYYSVINKKTIMDKKKIYIAGCGGMLGEAFYQQFKDDYIIKCTDKDVNAEWLSFLDFRDYDAYKKDVEEFKPDYLFHLGAYTDLEWCEQNADEVYLTNTLCVENAVYIANALDIPLLYISTAGIFDGKKQLYDDWDQPNPLGVYARSKYMGERFVVENARRYLVCRAGWMMGAGPTKDKKFIQKIMKQLKDGKKELFIVNDKDGTPTYTQDFARTVKNLIQKEYWGLYNCVCGGQTSRLEVCQELLKILGKEDEIKINIVTSEYFAKEYFADRPACERLWTRKLNIRGVNAMRDWKVSLKEYIDNYYLGYLD